MRFLWWLNPYHADDHGASALWRMPVTKRLHEVADIAKSLLGTRVTEANTRIDKQYLILNVIVRGGKHAKMSRLSFQLLGIIVEEALDMNIESFCVKGNDVHIRYTGTPLRAENARIESIRRNWRSKTLATASVSLFAFSNIQWCGAVHRMYSNKCDSLWEEYAMLSGLWQSPCQRTWKNYYYLVGCSLLQFAWIVFHNGVRFTPQGPVPR